MDRQRDTMQQRRDELARQQAETIPSERIRSQADLRPEDVTDAARRMPSARAPVGPRPGALRTLPAQQSLRRILSTHHTLRQAILLNEILGPPKALRKPDDM